MAKKDGVVAYLQGGLGNQLFILAAAWEQAERLKCDLLINDTHYDFDKNHPLQVQDLGSPASIIKLNPLTRFFIRFQNQLGLSKHNHKTYFEKSFRFSKEIFEISPGTTLVGYFQSEKYFPSVGSRISNAFNTLSLSDREKELFNKYPLDSFISLHLRRGDYVTNPEALKVHGLTERGYFINALHLLSVDSPNLPILVFTDNESLAKEELRGIPGLVFESLLKDTSDLATIAFFSRAKHAIISNSTFSWWGAWLLNQRSKSGVVIAPKPWFTSTSLDSTDLLPGNWSQLERS